MPHLSSRVTILAVGVSYYNDPLLPDLRGPEHDVENLKELLVENTETALFETRQFIDVLNPEAGELRQFLNEFLIGRSAEGDILIFYFSGHGVSIGRDDFGFCTTDTIIHPNTHIVLPLSVVKFSEILSSINLSNVIPVFIIDACYSGIAGKALNIPPIEAISNMQQQLHSFSASSYALLCSCSEYQTSTDTSMGGVFSHFLVDVASTGLSRDELNEPLLTLSDIFPKLNEKVLGYTGETIPRLYLGTTLPNFPFVINTKFAFRRYSLSPTYICILEQLWNNGQERDLGPDEISKLCGNGAYCNHNKLSFIPWQLVETISSSRRRRLTERGRQFMLGNLEVPKTVIQDPRNNEIVPADGTVQVKYEDF
jgi:hypothetical protein